MTSNAEYAPSEVRSPAAFYGGRLFIYGALLLWAVVCLFPIFWTVTTSFKMAPNIMKGQLIPFL